MDPPSQVSESEPFVAVERDDGGETESVAEEAQRKQPRSPGVDADRDRDRLLDTYARAEERGEEVERSGGRAGFGDFEKALLDGGVAELECGGGGGGARRRNVRFPVSIWVGFRVEKNGRVGRGSVAVDVGPRFVEKGEAREDLWRGENQERKKKIEEENKEREREER